MRSGIPPVARSPHGHESVRHSTPCLSAPGFMGLRPRHHTLRGSQEGIHNAFDISIGNTCGKSKRNGSLDSRMGRSPWV